MALPTGDIKFKSVITDKYVRPTDDGRLSADEDDPKNPILKFNFESVTGGTYRIKCVATGKYCQVKSGIPWVTPDGNIGTDDILFRIEGFTPDPTTTIRFIHKNLKRYASVQSGSDTGSRPDLWAHSETTDEDSKDVFVYSKF